MAHLIFHAKLSLTLRLATQEARITEHIVQRDFRNDRELIFADFTVNDRATPRVKSADDSTWNIPTGRISI